MNIHGLVAQQLDVVQLKQERKGISDANLFNFFLSLLKI